MAAPSSSASNVLKMRVRLELKKKIEILDFLATGKKHIEAAKQKILYTVEVAYNRLQGIKCFCQS